MYYFGCWSKENNSGHGLYAVGGQSVYRTALPFDYKVLDQLFREPGPQGAAVFWFMAGWTILWISDFTGDCRPGSNSAFIMVGRHTFETVLEIAAAKFPVQLVRIRAAGAITLRELK